MRGAAPATAVSATVDASACDDAAIDWMRVRVRVRVRARRTMRLARAPCRAPRRASTRTMATDREGALRALWARSFDAWIDVPGTPRGSTTFFKPRARDDDDGGARAVPAIARTHALFAITAHNPMGAIASAEANARANARLEADLTALAAANARRRWASYGFSEGWREDGYVVGFDLEDADDGRRAMVGLAVKYAQGAIYEYSSGDDDFTMRRRTVPAAMSDAVDADVIMVCCDEPGV